MKRLLLLAFALVLVVGTGADTLGTCNTRALKPTLSHRLQSYERGDQMGNGVIEDRGWQLIFTLSNGPMQSTKNRAVITIWRERDVFNPVNNSNSYLNWQALQKMSFNSDPEHPVNPQKYGYVVNEPGIYEPGLKDDKLVFEWAGGTSYTVTLPDWLFMNMPLPPNPEHRANVPIRYYIAYEVDFGGTHFSSAAGVTPSVTYVMFVTPVEETVNVIDSGTADWGSLLDDDDDVPTDTISEEKCRHPLFSINIATTPNGTVNDTLPGGCIRTFDVSLETMTCQKCGIQWKTNRYTLQGMRCFMHRMKEVSRRETGVAERVDGNCTRKVTTYEVVRACQNDCCGYREMTWESVVDQTTECPPEQGECPPHIWDIESVRAIGDTIVTQWINGRWCRLHYNIVEKSMVCSRCGFAEVIDKWWEYTGKECKPVPPPPRKPCWHKWKYYKQNHFIGSRLVETTVPPYDEDSLNVVVGPQKADLKMVKWPCDTSSVYMSIEPGTRSQWRSLYATDDYLGFRANDTGRLDAINYIEVQQFIDRLNRYAADSLSLHVVFSLPTVSEMRQLVDSLKNGWSVPLPSATCFYVDSIEVAEGTMVTGRIDLKGELMMYADDFSDPFPVFFLKATPYEAVDTERRGRYTTYIYRRCVKCGLLQMVGQNAYRR